MIFKLEKIGMCYFSVDKTYMTHFEEMATGVKCAEEYRIDTRNNIQIFDCATYCASVSIFHKIFSKSDLLSFETIFFSYQTVMRSSTTRNILDVARCL